MTQLAPIKSIHPDGRELPGKSTPIKPYKCFEHGYRAYIETAMRLVQYELDHIEQYMLPDEADVNIDFERAKLAAIKIGLQIAMNNIERDYAQEIKAMELLENQPWRGIHAKSSATLYHFGTKAD